MEYNEFKSIFQSMEKEIELTVSEERIKKLYDYMKILLEWNKKINLTAIEEEEEVIKKHFIDSLTILKYIKEDYKIIDVGTGAGFPGIPVAINNNANVVLLDSLNKRINFLNEVKKILNLKNIQTIHGRAEEIAKKKEHREKYDVAVSRAVAPMNILVEYLLPFVKVGGICICMKGPNATEEISKAKNAIKILGGEIEKQINIKINNEELNRNLILIKKVKNTSEKYPRKPGTPVKEPL